MDEPDAQDDVSRLQEPVVVAYAPPPPGSREKVLPEEVLRLIGTETYLSTACGTARRVEMKANSSSSLYRLAGELHGQCRLTHKYTYEACACPCHPQEAELREPYRVKGFPAGEFVEAVETVKAMVEAGAIPPKWRGARVSGYFVDEVLTAAMGDEEETGTSLVEAVAGEQVEGAAHEQEWSRNLRALGYVLLDLDRCQHGRHEGNSCYGCPGEWSKGNPVLPPGALVGYDHYGEEIRVPSDPEKFEDPKAWRTWKRGGKS